MTIYSEQFCSELFKTTENIKKIAGHFAYIIVNIELLAPLGLSDANIGAEKFSVIYLRLYMILNLKLQII